VSETVAVRATFNHNDPIRQGVFPEVVRSSISNAMLVMATG
jgi:hypothetical protein